MWNLRKNDVKETYLQNRNRVTHAENKLMITSEETGVRGINWETGIDIYILLYIK